MKRSMMPAEVDALIRQTVTGPGFVRANFGGPRRGGPESRWLRVMIRKFGERIQFEYFDKKRSEAKNPDRQEIETFLNDILNFHFSSIHVATETETIDIRRSKKGKLFVGRRPAEISPIISHNRTKALPLPEGLPDALLSALGVADSQGRVRPAMRAKFAQINEFLKHFLTVWGESGVEPGPKPVELLDAGCGSSYLTLAAHHYLTARLGVPARVLGVDVNDEVIRRSLERVDVLGAEGVRFVCDRIDRVNADPDIVLALHACDTATDAALACGVRRGARIILAVPCCHHHLNAQLTAESIDVLRPVLRHGILRERQADLFTDAFRALLLRIHGYRTEVVEFVSPEHTARNLMIRAVKTAKEGEPRFTEEYESLKHFTGLTPHLESLLATHV